MKKIEIIGDNYLGEWKNERIACRSIVLNEGMLLLSYETLTDQWMLPGGGLEADEDEIDCCIRETAEETGIIIKPSSCRLQIDEFYEDWKYVSRYFPAEAIGHCERQLTEREKEVGMEPRWLPLHEAVEIFSKHASYADTDEMRRGMYLREYTALQELFAKEEKKPEDFITDGILAYGVMAGRFLFEKERRTVYALSVFPHIGASDVFMYYQISREDYDRLLAMSLPDRVPEKEVPAEVTDACHRDFLCGESAYCVRNSFTVEDVDLSLTESFQ